MPMLPADASAFSRHRYDMARVLTRTCPTDLGQTIALTGSVARGVADRFSDIELTFFVDALRIPDDYFGWLREAGADVEPLEDDAVSPDAVLTKSWYRGVFIEAAWQTWAGCEAELRLAFDGATDDHWLLTRVWHIVHAVPLRSGPQLAEWQAQLAHYPDGLQSRLIHQATRAWAEPHWYPRSIVNLWPLVYRDARVVLAYYLLREVELALRVLFASNRQWEPDWKWLASESRRLTQIPRDLVARVNAVFALDDPVRSARGCLELILDILDLVPEQYNMGVQKARVREALQPELLLRVVDASGA